MIMSSLRWYPETLIESIGVPDDSVIPGVNGNTIYPELSYTSAKLMQAV